MRRAKLINTPATGAQLAARAAIVVIAGVLSYANSLSGPFFFDDQAAIVENGAIRSLDTVLLERRDSPLAGRPIVGYSFALNYQLDGLNVTGYHLANIVIHLACALLLFGITRRTLETPRLASRFGPQSLNLATATALLWAVHPLNTEAVNYVTQRTELLMAFFYLATLDAAILSARSKPFPWAAVAAASCALGMGCKESMATAPVMVALYDRIFLFDSFADAFRTRWRLYGALAASWLVLAYLILPGPRSNSAGFSSGIDSWTYLLNQARMITRYLRLAFWPSGLAIHYGPPEALSLSQVLPQALLIFGLILLVAIALARAPALGFLGAWFFLTLAPASSVIPIATEVGAERRMYLPLMALSALVVLLAFRAGLRRYLPEVAWACILIAIGGTLCLATAARNRVYGSPLELAQSNLAHWPSDAAHGAVGSELQMLHRDAEAIPELRLGARTDPRTMYNLGVALFNAKRFEETIAALEPLVTRFPMREEVPWARRIRGQAFLMMGRWPQAITELRMTLSMTPRDVEARKHLANALFSQGVENADLRRYNEAAQSFREALKYDPSNVRLRQNLAAALMDSGDLAGGLAEARSTVADNPTHADSYNLIGRALAMQGHLEAAATELQQAVRLRPEDAAFREDLDRVLAALKK